MKFIIWTPINVSEEKTADIDVSTLQSSSSKKEGAEIGYNKKCKGKSCFQLSATFIGKVFTDARLFSGHCNPIIFFQKAVKRIISLGFDVKIIRADSAYLSHENLFFLKKLSLGYAIGAPATFAVVKKGRKTFLRNILQKGLRIDINGKVEVAFNGRYTWHLKRLLNKMKQIELVLIAEISDY